MKSDPGRIEREQAFWEEVRLNEPLVHINRCEDAAKSLITLITILSTLYTGVIATSAPFKQLVGTYFLLVALIPLLIWLVSLSLASYIIMPRRYQYEAGVDIQSQYAKIQQVKHRVLKWGYGLLIFSMLCLFAEGVYFLVMVPPSVVVP